MREHKSANDNVPGRKIYERESADIRQLVLTGFLKFLAAPLYILGAIGLGTGVGLVLFGRVGTHTDQILEGATHIFIGGVILGLGWGCRCLAQNYSLRHYSPINQLWLAITYSRAGKSERGVEILTQTIKAVPQMGAAYAARAECYCQLHLFQQALQDIYIAIATHPDWSMNYALLGNILEEQEDYTGALTAYERAWSINQELTVTKHLSGAKLLVDIAGTSATSLIDLAYVKAPLLDAALQRVKTKQSGPATPRCPNCARVLDDFETLGGVCTKCDHTWEPKKESGH